MKKAFVLAIALLVELFFSACSATFRVKQPGGTEMSYHGPAYQATTAMKQPPVKGPSKAYTQAMGACAEAVQQNPGATYIVNADGGCTYISGQRQVTGPANGLPGGRINYSSPNQARQVSATGEFTIINPSKKNLPVTIYGNNSRTRITVRARRSTTLNLSPGKYRLQIANSPDSQEFEITAGKSVEATINP